MKVINTEKFNYVSSQDSPIGKVFYNFVYIKKLNYDEFIIEDPEELAIIYRAIELELKSILEKISLEKSSRNSIIPPVFKTDS